MQFFQAQAVIAWPDKKISGGEKPWTARPKPRMKLDQFQVIGQRQLGVEAALEQDPAAAVVLEFRELGRQARPKSRT